MSQKLNFKITQFSATRALDMTHWKYFRMIVIQGQTWCVLTELNFMPAKLAKTSLKLIHAFGMQIQNFLKWRIQSTENSEIRGWRHD